MRPFWLMSTRSTSRQAPVENHPYHQLCPLHFSVHRKVEPLEYSKAAAAASLSCETLRTCIQSTVSLLSGCLQNGENVAVVLKDIGVLHIDGLTFQMKFFFDFLEKLSGKDTFRRAVFKVSCVVSPWPRHCRDPCCARTRPTRTWPAARAVQVLCCCQLSPPWAPRVPNASAFTRTSHILPVSPLQAPWLLDTVVSRVAPVASMALSGCAVVFPM